jgi:hypothetical protein
MLEMFGHALVDQLDIEFANVVRGDHEEPAVMGQVGVANGPSLARRANGYVRRSITIRRLPIMAR